MTEHKLLSPCPFCGEKLFLDIDEGGGVAILHSLKEKDCFFPSILEIEMPVGTTLEQMIEKINRRPIQESFEHAIAEIEELGAQEAERKEFCPNCEAVVPCTHEAELFVCDICGEDFAKYIVSRNCTLPDVSTTQDVLTSIKTSNSIENTNPDYYKHELVRRDEIIARLKEDAERLATRAVYWDDYGKEYECIHLECSGHSENILFDHAPDCPITLHRALMKELE